MFSTFGTKFQMGKIWEGIQQISENQTLSFEKKVGNTGTNMFLRKHEFAIFDYYCRAQLKRWIDVIFPAHYSKSLQLCPYEYLSSKKLSIFSSKIHNSWSIFINQIFSVWYCKNCLKVWKCNIFKKINTSWMLHFTGENWQFLRRDVFIW